MLRFSYVEQSHCDKASSTSSSEIFVITKIPIVVLVRPLDPSMSIVQVVGVLYHARGVPSLTGVNTGLAVGWQRHGWLTPTYGRPDRCMHGPCTMPCHANWGSCHRHHRLPPLGDAGNLVVTSSVDRSMERGSQKFTIYSGVNLGWFFLSSWAVAGIEEHLMHPCVN
jgi:hypothetical protein